MQPWTEFLYDVMILAWMVACVCWFWLIATVWDTEPIHRTSWNITWWNKRLWSHNFHVTVTDDFFCSVSNKNLLSDIQIIVAHFLTLRQCGFRRRIFDLRSRNSTREVSHAYENICLHFIKRNPFLRQILPVNPAVPYLTKFVNSRQQSEWFCRKYELDKFPVSFSTLRETVVFQTLLWSSASVDTPPVICCFPVAWPTQDKNIILVLRDRFRMLNVEFFLYIFEHICVHHGLMEVREPNAGFSGLLLGWVE